MKRACLAAALLAAWPAAHASEFCDVEGATEQVAREKTAQWELFKQRKFAEVDAYLSRLVAQHEAGRISDARLARYLEGWQQSDPATETLALEWVHERPKSYAARFALASHYYQAGWNARGGKFIDETSKEQIAGMRRSFHKAAAILDEADKLTAKPTLSAALRVSMGEAAGFDRDELYRSAIKSWPDTFQVRVQYIRKSGPKWGGSIEQLESIIADAKSLSADDQRYIRYLVLQEIGVYYDNTKQYAKAAEYYKRSVPLCVGVDASLWYLETVQVRYLQDYEGAVKSASEMIRRHPRDGMWWAKRAYVYDRWHKFPQALADYRKAIELGNPDASFNLGFFYEQGLGVKQDFQKAMDLYLTADRLGVKGARAQAEKLGKSSGIPLK